jgi:hypothetical protein
MHGNMIRKSTAVAFDLANHPINRDKVDKGFTHFLMEIGTRYPEEIKEHSLPYVMALLESEVQIYLTMPSVYI